MTEVIDWPGKSGRTYRYWFFNINNAKDEPGNYMFVKRLPNGNYVPIYIGQCDSFRNRCPSHERLADARRAGATEAIGHTTPAGEFARLAEERDLIELWSPRLNVHFRKVS